MVAQKQSDALSEAVSFCKKNEISNLSFERYDRGYRTSVEVSYTKDEEGEISEGEETSEEEEIV